MKNLMGKALCAVFVLSAICSVYGVDAAGTATTQHWTGSGFVTQSHPVHSDEESSQKKKKKPEEKSKKPRSDSNYSANKSVQPQRQQQVPNDLKNRLTARERAQLEAQNGENLYARNPRSTRGSRTFMNQAGRRAKLGQGAQVGGQRGSGLGRAIGNGIKRGVRATGRGVNNALLGINDAINKEVEFWTTPKTYGR